MPASQVFGLHLQAKLSGDGMLEAYMGGHPFSSSAALGYVKRAFGEHLDPAAGTSLKMGSSKQLTGSRTPYSTRQRLVYSTTRDTPSDCTVLCCTVLMGMPVERLSAISMIIRRKLSPDCASPCRCHEASNDAVPMQRSWQTRLPPV